MHRPQLLLILAATTIAAFSAAATNTIETDICIYGGTSAGVIAAVQAAQMGKKVVLLEAGQHFGGMSVEGIGGPDIDNQPFQNSPAVGGLALEFYRRVSAHYGRSAAFEEMLRTRAKNRSLWTHDCSVAEKIFDDWLAEAGVTALRAHRLKERQGVTKQEARITALHCDNGTDVLAKVFIDTTYEGDLLAAAGVSFTVGREGNAKYGETKNGVRTVTTHSQLHERIDPYRTPGDPGSGTIYGVSAEPNGQQGDASEAIQGFNYRLLMTTQKDKLIPIAKPATYDPTQYELQKRCIAAGGTIAPASWHPLAGFFTGSYHHWNTASYAERDQMLKESLDHLKGLFWFMQHDESIPQKLRDQWLKYGTRNDQFTDNGGWPRMFYVRNGRRMISDHVVTEAHGRKDHPEPVTDPIGLIWWPHDLHNTRRLIKDGAVWLEGAVFDEKHDWIPFGHAYRSIVPKAAECTNLLAPTCPSMSYVAYGAFRLEFNFMIAGQSAATAAAQAIDDQVTVQNIAYPKLRQRLLADGQVLEVPNDLPISTTK
ncbi:MAG: FAD-dependent oxidoreductase [Verrucomicrobiaceae bacterium]|nr:FAD-dependent oxidoreductase [Verrucomicrobiaceae bacterium]